MKSDYIELRTRSAFSFLAGASVPEALVARAAELGYDAIALGDRDGVYGAPRFHEAAVKAGLRAIVGCTLTMADRSSLYLLVSTRTGYRHLCRLLTTTKLRAAKGESVTNWDDLAPHTDGLICLASAHDGLSLESSLPRLQQLFPDRLYLELQRHLDPHEERRNRIHLALAERFRLPLVATNDVRHATASGRPLLDVLTCLHEKTTLDTAGRRLLKNAERHLKSADDMAALFRDVPAAVVNTRRIAEACEFTLADLGYRFPDYPLPPGETPSSYLRALTYAGARTRYGTISARVRTQLEHELAVIGKLELEGYFLIVWDLVRFCREQHILMQGRGSAANSAVCYALGITAVDAVKMELLFERFLSEERGEWPDIDIDLPSGDQRERVIQYVYQRYGARGAAMTANVITYRVRSAVREVGKTLGFSPEQVDRLSKLLQRFEFRDDQDDLGKQLRAGGIDPDAPRVRLLVDLVDRIQDLPRHLGQHSGGMVIAAGRLDEVVPLEPATMPGRVVVQWDKDDCADLGIIKVDLLGLGMMAVIEEAIPLIREHEHVEIDLAQLPPNDVKTYGMLQRADTIGVFQVESRAQMATLPRMKPDHFYDLVVEVAIIRPGPIVGQMVHPYLNRRNGREPVTYDHPDLEPILKRTLGVPLFQEQLLRMAMALAGFTGGEAEELRRAMGFKRSVERMRQIEARLRSGMAARGINGEKADTIIRSITSFALYGFPESHAASFALLAYASAYLRAHHLAAFTCAMLNNWPMGFYHPATLVKDAQRHGLRVLPIDVTRSGWKCSVEREKGVEGMEEGVRGIEKGVRGLGGYAVRQESSRLPSSLTPNPVTPNPEMREGVKGLGGYVVREESSRLPSSLTPNPVAPNPLVLRLGLRYVTGLREETGKRIEAARAAAAFESMADVIVRADLRDDEVQKLAHLGAFAAFNLNRREALWQASAIPHGPLFDNVVKVSRSSTRINDIKDGNVADAATIVSRPDRLAPSDGLGQGVLPRDEEIPARGAIWPDEPDPASGSVRAGEYCGGQRPSDEARLCALPSDRPGQSARVGDVPTPDIGSENGERGIQRSSSDANRLSRQATEPPNPVPPSSPLTPNPGMGQGVKGLRGYAVGQEDHHPPSSLTPNPLTPNPVTPNPLPCPLPTMTALDRTLADYKNSGVTVGPHIVKHLREALAAEGVLRAGDVKTVPNGRWVKIAGLVIVRQRPGTAKGFCFITLEDETGTANAVVVPDMFQRHRALIHTASLLLIEGPLQKVDGVIHVRARRFRKLELPRQPLTMTGSGYRMRVTPEDDEPPTPPSHDFR